MKEKSLTNEKLRENFKSDFDLANYAIKLARSIILTDTDATINDVLREVGEQASKKTND